jgi:hypothetical protein
MRRYRTDAAGERRVDRLARERLSADFPLGVELEVFIRREDAERFIEEVRCDEPRIGDEAQDRGAGWRRAAG